MLWWCRFYTAPACDRARKSGWNSGGRRGWSRRRVWGEERGSPGRGREEARPPVQKREFFARNGVFWWTLGVFLKICGGQQFASAYPLQIMGTHSPCPPWFAPTFVTDGRTDGRTIAYMCMCRCVKRRQPIRQRHGGLWPLTCVER